MKMNISEIAQCLHIASPVDAGQDITGVSINTRTLKPGDLFVAFQGAHVDGHAFIADAIQRGAAAILSTKPQAGLDKPVLVYPNLDKALALIAAQHRAQLSCRVVALTGSNGKTTVKEMLSAILGSTAFVTPGNWNNHLGVPLSILQVMPSHQYAVFELGANHVGEIAQTVALVKPDVALINNIGSAHLEGFGSIEGIARGKGEIYEGLLADGTAVINAEDAYAHFWDDVIQDKQVLRFSSIDSEADVYASHIKVDTPGGAVFKLVMAAGSCDITLRVPGMHHVRNALAAASCASALGIGLSQISKGLMRFTGVSGRLMPKKTPIGALVLDDTYNANLNSVLTAINVLASYSGRRILVLGDMGELGDYAAQHHEAVGVAAKQEGIDVLLTCGIVSQAASKAFGESAQHFDDQTQLLEMLKPILSAETTVLVKGSRSSTMEHVVEGLFE